MILLENSILKLEYTPATDILEIVYPDLQGYVLPEVKSSIRQMVETIRNYDVRKLLIDVSKTVITISDDENRELSLYLASELTTTRLLKFARIQSRELPLEDKAQQNIEFIKGKGLLTYQVQTFTDRTVALQWLKHND